jgi:hypothetical protein
MTRIWQNTYAAMKQENGYVYARECVVSVQVVGDALALDRHRALT